MYQKALFNMLFPLCSIFLNKLDQCPLFIWMLCTALLNSFFDLAQFSFSLCFQKFNLSKKIVGLQMWFWSFWWCRKSFWYTNLSCFHFIYHSWSGSHLATRFICLDLGLWRPFYWFWWSDLSIWMESGCLRSRVITIDRENIGREDKVNSEAYIKLIDLSW